MEGDTGLGRQGEAVYSHLPSLTVINKKQLSELCAQESHSEAKITHS